MIVNVLALVLAIYWKKWIFIRDLFIPFKNLLEV